jgi:hypothetical protein
MYKIDGSYISKDNIPVLQKENALTANIKLIATYLILIALMCIFFSIMHQKQIDFKLMEPTPLSLKIGRPELNAKRHEMCDVLGLTTHSIPITVKGRYVQLHNDRHANIPIIRVVVYDNNGKTYEIPASKAVVYDYMMRFDFGKEINILKTTIESDVLYENTQLPSSIDYTRVHILSEDKKTQWKSGFLKKMRYNHLPIVKKSLNYISPEKLTKYPELESRPQIRNLLYGL